jgi:uncharacterized protein involved in outer membrane biogenesis
MRWKWITLTVGLMLIVLLGAVYLILVSYDYNALKPRIARLVRDATGRDLKFSGDIKLDFGLSPRLVVRDVSFGNAPWGSQPDMIKVEKLQAQARLLPLLLGHVELEHIDFSGVDLWLETDATGQGNWDLGLDRRASGKAGGFKVPRIDVESILIENLHVVFRNGRTGVETRSTLADLKAASRENHDLLSLDLHGDYNGQPITASGKIGSIPVLLAGDRFPVELSGQFSGATFNLAGTIENVPHLKGIDLMVHASGKDLQELGFGEWNRIPKMASFDAEGRLKGSKDALAFEDFVGNFSGGGTDLMIRGRVGDLLGVNHIDLGLKGSGKNLAALEPIFEVKLPETEQFTFQGRLTGSAKTLSLQDGQSTARKGSLRMNLKGGIKDLIVLAGMDVQLQASGAAFAEVGPLFDSKTPELGPFEVTCHITGSESALSLNALSFIVDRSDFNGRGTLVFHRRPKVTLVLESSVVDFTRIMNSVGGEKRVVRRESEGERGRLFPGNPLSFAFLKNLDADILLNARNIHAREARFDLGHVTLKLDDGHLDVDKIEATYRGAKIRGNFHLDPYSGPHLSTDFLVQNLDLGNCFKEMGVTTDQVEGKADIAVKVESKGDSIRDLMANLDGKVGGVMAKGYMPKFLDLLSMDLSRKVIPFWGKHKEAGRIKCAVVEFDIKSGIATSDAFIFNTKLAILGGEGDINLGTEQVNFLLVPKPKKPSLISLATNLRVTGSIVDPKVRPDKVSLLTKGAKFLSTLAIGPLGLLVPFVNLGANQKHPCDILSNEKWKQAIPVK